MNYIVVDTNMFFLNFYMESMEWKKLLWLCKQKGYKLICPQFIFEEVIKKYSDAITTPLNGLKALRKDKKFQLLSIDIKGAKKAYYIEKYRKTLSDIFSNNGIDIIPYPKNENYLKLIAEKYFQSKRPFGVEKQSFPDAIIWYSIFDILQTSDSTGEIHFITANYKDFSRSKEEKDVFHEDYVNELSTIQKEKLFLYENISAFISSQEETIEAFKDEIREGFKDELEKNLKTEIITFNDIPALLGVSLDDSDIQEVIEARLFNSNLEGEYFEGWGENVELDSNIDINDVSVEFANDFEAELIIELEVYANYSIVTLNPMYEDLEDEEYISENGHGGDFNVRISISFEIDDSFYDEKFDNNRFDHFVENYLELDKPEIELF